MTGKSDFLIAGLDLLLAFLVVFVLAFLAVRYDEVRGPENQFVSLEDLQVSLEGDFSNLRFLGIRVWKTGVRFEEFKHGNWINPSPLFSSDWVSTLKSRLKHNQLPIVIYEMETSHKLGDVVREVARSGQPVGIARLE